MNVKGSSEMLPPGDSDWLPDVDDPADLFALLYDALRGTSTSHLDAIGSVSLGRAGFPGSRAGDALASWYHAPEVKRCADHVYQLACDRSLNRPEIAAAAPSDPGAAAFAVLLGLDRALHRAHPRERRAAMGGLSSVGVRYVRTGRLNTDRVPGALLPRAAHVGASGEDHLADCFAAVERIPGPTWSSILHRRLATHLDPGHAAAGGRDLRVAVAPLLAHDDLALTVVSDWAGQPDRFRLAPRDTPHLRERLRRVLAALDASRAVIAAFPDYTLTKSLLEYWQELLRSTPAPLTGSLKWIMVGGGAVDTQAPSVSQVFVLDRDFGEVVLAQEKLVRSRLEAQQAALTLLRGGQALPKPAVSANWTEALGRPAPAKLTEDIAPGTALRLIDASLGRVAIAAGPPPDRLEPVLRHVTHLLRAELSSQPELEELRDSLPSTGGLLLASSLLLSGTDPAGPIGGGVIAVSSNGDSPNGVMALTFQPDELAVFSVPADAAARQVQVLPTDEPSGAPALRDLRHQRATEPHTFLVHGAADAQELMGALDPARQPRFVAMTLGLLAEIDAARGWLSSARATAGRVIGTARSAGAQFIEADARALQCRLSYWGEQPLSAVEAAAQEALTWAENHGYLRLAITALDVLAQVAAQQRRFDSARRLLHQATENSSQLVAGSYGAELAVGHAIAAASVQLAAGDVDAAVGALERGDSVLRRLGAGPWRAPVLALSARVQHRLGSSEAAHDLLELCLRHGAGRDIAVQANVHGVSALLHADEGDELLAEQRARTAVKVGDWSERVDVQAQARMDLASVLLRTGRMQEAALPAGWALRLYERRGDEVSAVAVRELISQHKLEVRAPGLRAEAWIIGSEPILMAGHSTKIGVKLHTEVAAGPGTNPPRRKQSEEVLVTLAVGRKADVRPNGRRVNLPVAGSTEPIIFEVIPRDPIPLWLHFLVYLYRDGALLQELGITMPVLPSVTGGGQ